MNNQYGRSAVELLADIYIYCEPNLLRRARRAEPKANVCAQLLQSRIVSLCVCVCVR